MHTSVTVGASAQRAKMCECRTFAMDHGRVIVRLLGG
jgi:hypothetical protein